MGRLCYDKLDVFTGCFDQFAELYARRAGSFTGTAAQATIHMLDKFGGDRHAPIGNCLHLVNTATRRVHLDTENCVSWTGRQTETTVNALAHQVVGVCMAMERSSIG